MNEMHVEAVDDRGELGEAVERRFALAPVVVLEPVAADLLDPLERRALAPIIDQFRLRPASATQSRPQVVEHFVRDGNAEWLDGVGHGSSLLPRMRACGQTLTTLTPSIDGREIRSRLQ